MHAGPERTHMNEVPVSILVVDDNPANRMALIAALAPLGLQIVEAGSGRAGLRELLAHDFAAVLLDINLPDMNGYEIAELVRKRPRNTHTPILFVTAERDADVDRERGYASGAVDYLVIPVVPATLRAKVTVYVDQDPGASRGARNCPTALRHWFRWGSISRAPMSVSSSWNCVAARCSKFLKPGTRASW